MTNLDEFVTFAHRLADISGETILPHFRNLKTVDDKSLGEDFDPVTVADRAAEEVIRSEIAAHWPGHGITGEEFSDSNADAEFCWIIDPIDGTRPFLAGLPVWGSLIGLQHRGKPVIGMMNQPFTRERFWAGPSGAFYRGPNSEKPLETRKCAGLEQAIVTTTGPDMFASDADRKTFDAMSARGRMRWFSGDCYGYCLLAAGQIDVIAESGLSPHDIVPLVPIVEGAGGKITTWDGGPVTDGGSVVACGDPSLHDEVIEALAR